MMVARVPMAYLLFFSLLTVKLWSKQLSKSARDTTPIAPLIGDDENSIIQLKSETGKEGGDSVTFALLTSS